MMPVALLFLREHPTSQGIRKTSPTGRLAALRMAFTEWHTWLLAAFALFTGGVLVTSVTMFVPILSSRGESVASAALYQSILGASLIAGRLLIGFLIDRIFAPYVMMVLLFVTTLGFFLLYQASTPLAFSLAAVGIGLAIGAEVDFLGFMVSRYFPRAAFASIFAVMFSMYALGASLAPLLFGWLAEANGSFGPGLLLFCGMMLALALSMLALPRYTSFGPAGTQAIPVTEVRSGQNT